MLYGLYLSAQGAEVQSLRQDVLANNLANASTPAFKRHLLRRPGTSVMAGFVHVNHFSVRSLRLVLEGAGFGPIAITPGAPECVPASCPWRTRRQARQTWGRLAVYHAARLIPGGVHTPLALNLQAFAVKPA